MVSIFGCVFGSRFGVIRETFGQISMSLVLKVKKLDPRAQLPRYALTGDAGLDIFCLDAVVIPPHERVVVHTGVAIEIPAGFVGLMWDRGGHAAKRGLTNMGGVYDSGYRGEVLPILYNTTEAPVTLETGSGVSQLLIQTVENVEFSEVEELSSSERGENRWSSTGV